MYGAGPGWQRSLSSLSLLAGWPAGWLSWLSWLAVLVGWYSCFPCDDRPAYDHRRIVWMRHVAHQVLTHSTWRIAALLLRGQNRDPPRTEQRTQGQRRELFMRLCLINFMGPSSIQSYYCMCTWHIHHSNYTCLSSPRAPAEAAQ